VSCCRAGGGGRWGSAVRGVSGGARRFGRRRGVSGVGAAFRAVLGILLSSFTGHIHCNLMPLAAYWRYWFE
jgi:hypothetical protein